MARTIVLNTVRVNQLLIDYERQVVTAVFELLDADGVTWIRNESSFFATMPPKAPIYAEDGITITGYEDYPPEWFLLPASYMPIFISLLTDAKAALTARFLIEAV